MSAAKGMRPDGSLRGDGRALRRVVARNQPVELARQPELERSRMRCTPALLVLDHSSPEEHATENARDGSRVVAAAEVRQRGSRVTRGVYAAQARLVRRRMAFTARGVLAGTDLA